MDRRIQRSTDHAGPRYGGAAVPFLIAFGATALLTIGLSVSVRLVSKLTSDPRTPEQRASEVTDQLLGLIAKGDSDATYKWFTRDLREGTSELSWAKAVSEWKELGALKAKESKQFNEGQSGSRRWTEVQYQADYEKGPATVAIRYLRAADGRWLLDSFNIAAETDPKKASKPE